MTEALDWNALQSFLAVVRAGRLTVAARQLGVTHSTLSRHVVGLERSLGVQLFVRRPAGYTLTAQGERLRDAAQSVESGVLGAISDISNARMRVTGTVRIGAPEGFGTRFLAPRLGELATQQPDLSIQLVTLPRIFSLSKREADIAIGLTAPQEGRLHAHRLTDYDLGLFAATEYLEAHAEITSVADLRGHRFIGYVEDMIYSPELDYLPLVSRDIRPAFTSSSLIAQLNATVSGYGLCVLPLFLVAGEHRLSRVLANTVMLRRAFWLIVHSDMRDLARVRVTADFITSATRSSRYGFVL